MKPNSRPQPARPEKQHLSPRATALVLIPSLAILVALAWLYLRHADHSQDRLVEGNVSDVTDSAGTETGSGPGHSRIDNRQQWEWARPVADHAAWETDAILAEAWDDLDNPASDGWDTELLTEQVMAQFKKLSGILASADPLEAQSVGFLADPSVHVHPLRPRQLDPSFSDDFLTVQRGSEPSPSEFDSPTTDRTAEAQQGLAALAQALQEFVSPYPDREHLRLKIKVFRVEKADAGANHDFVTHQTVEIFGPTSTGLMEQNAIWLGTWRLPGSNRAGAARAGDKPLLTRLWRTEYEEVSRNGGTLFSDCTDSVLHANASYHQQLLSGYNHWLERNQFNRFFSILGNPGIAVGDLNGDGLDDLYVCQEAGLPNLLYLQNPDGSLRDASDGSGVNWLQNSTTALIADFDNDGHPDLAVAVNGGVVLARGDGTGRFTLAAVLDTSDHIMTLSAADYDLDGRLDLFAGAYHADGIERTSEDIVGGGQGRSTYTDANDGGRNSLFRNESGDGQWRFRDVTDLVGLGENNQRYSLASSWEDYDNDGDLDLYVANDFGPNTLYRNDRQPDGSIRFREVAREVGAEDRASGMSVSWGDFDRDGWMDLYVSNMFSYAGNRIMFQDQFRADDPHELKDEFRRFARGNTLLRNRGMTDTESTDIGVSFDDHSLLAAVNRGRWAWASLFMDVNNDGWEDLVVANGYITTDDTGDL